MTDTTTPPTAHDTARLLRTVRRVTAQTQDHVAALLGVSTAARRGTVGAMLEANARRAPGYWIQLLLSTGIATLGLVLDSTAVVIGAMLISPLMGPILELGMGFAVGSSLLLLRATLRVLVSIVWVVAGAAIIVWFVPFHDVTGEIAARAAPTALDLFVAIFCALAAVYTTLRPGSDTTAAAAGTAIGIALVPPLCVAGLGLGTGSASIASGAMLLFIANLSGILVFAVAAFLLLGFNRVDAGSLEEEYMGRAGTRFERIAQRGHQLLAGWLGSRYGLAMRLLVPVVFLAIVYVPLSRALDDVAWQIRVRDEIRRILAPESTRAVQSALSLERHSVTLRLWMVGSRADAQALEHQLETRIAAVSGVQPVVTVRAVPDVAMLAGAAGREPRAASTLRLDGLTARVTQALHGTWPADAAGPLAGWQLEFDARGEVVLRVWHVGPTLGSAADALLARALAVELGTPLRIADEPLPSEPLVARRGAERAWLDTATRIIALTLRTDSLVACVRGPVGRSASDRAVRTGLRAAAASDERRLNVEPASAWSIRVGSSCPAGR